MPASKSVDFAAWASLALVTAIVGLTNANAGADQGSTAKIIGSFAIGESDAFVLNVLLHGGVRQNKSGYEREFFYQLIGGIHNPLQLDDGWRRQAPWSSGSGRLVRHSPP